MFQCFFGGGLTHLHRSPGGLARQRKLPGRPSKVFLALSFKASNRDHSGKLLWGLLKQFLYIYIDVVVFVVLLLLTVKLLLFLFFSCFESIVALLVDWLVLLSWLLKRCSRVRTSLGPGSHFDLPLAAARKATSGCSPGGS